MWRKQLCGAVLHALPVMGAWVLQLRLLSLNSYASSTPKDSSCHLLTTSSLTSPQSILARSDPSVVMTRRAGRTRLSTRCNPHRGCHGAPWGRAAEPGSEIHV